MVVIVMGVAGSGKTTVGRCLAGTLGWIYCEGDDLHPPDNLQKMGYTNVASMAGGWRAYVEANAPVEV